VTPCTTRPSAGCGAASSRSPGRRAFGMTIDKEKIIVQEAVRNVCDLFGIDPYTSISEGTLILGLRPHKAKEVIRRLGDKGIPRAWWGRSWIRGRGCVSSKTERRMN